MSEGTLLMTKKDRRKVVILSRVSDRLITVLKAAELMGVSYRQGKRLWQRYRQAGELAVLHQGRGVVLNKLPKTAFGLVCERMGIQIISACSPQAKGRVKRKHGVRHDRFVKELRLRGAKTIAEANMILEGGFIKWLNSKFARQPIATEDLHDPVFGQQDLRDIFCFEESRSVRQD